MTTTTVLSTNRVRKIILDCVFRDGEPHDNCVEGHAVMTRLGFHSERLASHKEEIGLMLAELPAEFMQSSGGGMSFLNACIDRHGNHWAEHRTIDELLCLGLATDQVAFCLPREIWAVLPGGMPYFVVKQ